MEKNMGERKLKPRAAYRTIGEKAVLQRLTELLAGEGLISPKEQLRLMEYIEKEEQQTCSGQ